MSNEANASHLIYGILSIAFPILTVASVLTYQSVAHSGFWESLGPGDSTAGALMAFGELMQLFVWTVFACVGGLLLAAMSRMRQGRGNLTGLLGLALNGSVLLLLVSLYVLSLS